MRGIKKSAVVLSALLAGVCLASSAQAADDYKIKLDHPYKVGDKFDVSIKVKVKQIQKLADQEQKQDYTCVAEGTETVEAVTDKGKQPSKYTFKVTKCTKDGAALIPEGSTVTAESKDGHTDFMVDGAAPAAEVAAALTDIFETTDPKDPTTDEVMGTDEPQKVGGTWKLHADLMAKELGDKQLPFTADDIKGGGKLDDVSKVQDKEVQAVTLTVDGAFDSKALPNGATMKDAKMAVEIKATIPVDENTPPTKATENVNFSFTVAGPNGSMEIKVERTKETAMTPAK